MLIMWLLKQLIFLNRSGSNLISLLILCFAVRVLLLLQPNKIKRSRTTRLVAIYFVISR